MNQSETVNESKNGKISSIYTKSHTHISTVCLQLYKNCQKNEKVKTRKNGTTPANIGTINKEISARNLKISEKLSVMCRNYKKLLRNIKKRHRKSHKVYRHDNNNEAKSQNNL